MYYIMDQLVALGYEWVAYEHDGEITTVTRIDVERRTKCPSLKTKKN